MEGVQKVRKIDRATSTTNMREGASAAQQNKDATSERKPRNLLSSSRKRYVCLDSGSQSGFHRVWTDCLKSNKANWTERAKQGTQLMFCLLVYMHRYFFALRFTEEEEKKQRELENAEKEEKSEKSEFDVKRDSNKVALNHLYST